jgi:flagellar biosynthesis protein FlhF
MTINDAWRFEMKIKRYTADSMRAALAQVRAEQGPDAVILSSRRGQEGIEVIAAVDYDEACSRTPTASASADGGRQSRQRGRRHPAPPRSPARRRCRPAHRAAAAGCERPRARPQRACAAAPRGAPRWSRRARAAGSCAAHPRRRDAARRYGYTLMQREMHEMRGSSRPAWPA